MRTPHRVLRALLVVVLALTTAAALPATAAAGASHDGDHGRAHAHALLEQVRDLLDGSAKPAKQHGRLPRVDVTLKMRDLRRSMSALSSADQAQAADILARPTPDSRSCAASSLSYDQVLPYGHFCVHYSSGGLLNPIAPTSSTQAAKTASVLEHVWYAEVSVMGFRQPPADADGKVDVYLDDLGDQGIYGYCATDTTSLHSASYCELDNDFSTSQFGGTPDNSLKVTAAHEFFHAIQFGYDAGEDTWFMEGTAVWMEDEVYPTINDYLQYVRYSPITYPRTPVDYAGVDGSSDLFHRYGAVIFWKFLSARYGRSIIHSIWYDTDPANTSHYSIQSVASILASRGTSLTWAFAQFGIWITKPSGMSTFPDRGYYPTAPWWGVYTLSSSARDTGTHGIRLSHLTNAAIYVRSSGTLSSRAKLVVSVNAPPSYTNPVATVQFRRTDGRIGIYTVPLNSSGDGVRVFGFAPSYARVAVVNVSNAGWAMTACGTDSAWRYSCGGHGRYDGQPFYVRAYLRPRG